MKCIRICRSGVIFNGNRLATTTDLGLPGRGANPKGGANLLFGQNLPKTA